jgi:16S rRNA (adenine1518-N6/adenine1519-N6)-dimethyltransferase
MLPKPKKSLGQNFLFDKNVLAKIVAACAVTDADRILEIGPGHGTLTALLAGKAAHVYAVEVDKKLFALLKENFRRQENITFICHDFLTLELEELFAAVGRKLRVIGNIPYYITTPIIARLIEHRGLFSNINLTVQKEFGRRMAAQAGDDDYGSFSLFAQYYTVPTILFDIKRKSFTPAPKVDSCFVRLAVREKPAVEVSDERRFFFIIRSAFQQRRKTLRNSLARVVSQQSLEAFFSRYSIDPRIRPEQLSLQDFANLANTLV